MSDWRKSAEVLAVAVAVALVVELLIGRSSAGDAAARVRAEMRDSVAYQVAVAIAPLRRAKAEADSARLAAERKLAKVRTTARVTLTVTERAVDSVRADTATDTVALYRNEAVLLAAYDSLAAAFRAYLHADSTDRAMTDSARTVTEALIVGQDRALAAMTQARDAWRQAATCRIWLIKCPTRVQSAVFGAVVASAIAVVVLR